MITKKTHCFSPCNDGFEVLDSSGKLRFLACNGIPFLPVANLAVVWGQPTVSMEEYKGDSALYFKCLF